MKVKRRRKGRKLKNSSILCISAIVMLNLMGMTYGSWNDGLNIKTSISTGFIQPEFDTTEMKIVGNDKHLTLTPSFDGRTLDISGWCYPTYNEILFVDITNRGTVPIRIDDNDTTYTGIVKNIIPQFSNEDLIKKGDTEQIKIHLKVDSENELMRNYTLEDLEDMENSNGSEEPEVLEEYDFKYELQFQQGL